MNRIFYDTGAERSGNGDIACEMQVEGKIIIIIN